MPDYVDTLVIEYLSAEDRIDSYDPTGACWQWFCQHFPKETCLEQLSPLFFEDPQQLVHEYCARFLSDKELNSKHRPIVEYERELLSKFGRQGGKIPWSLAAPVFKPYYLLPKKVRFGKVAKVGLRTLLRLLRARLRKFAPPALIRDFFLKDTAFGCPYGGSKKDEYKHKQAPFGGWQHPYPCLPNIRYMRNSYRGIFCSSGFDCDYIEPELSAVRNWLKEQFPHIFGAWRDPREYVHRDLGEAVWRNKFFLETDFKKMDQHFTLSVVKELILPIYQLLLAPADYLHFAAFVEEAFEQPLLCGNELWTGEHTLFSGLPFTNDFETLYDVVIYLGAHVLSDQQVDTFGFVFKAIGDDVVYCGSEDVVRNVYELVKGEFTLNGVILSEEKTRMQRGSCRFCRNVYYPACRRSVNKMGYSIIVPAYPLILAVNNCLQPESTAPSWRLELLSMFTRLDNGSGNYQFDNVVNWLYSHILPAVMHPIPIDAEREFELLQHKDWWFKVYGTTYTLGESRAAQIYRLRTKSA